MYKGLITLNQLTNLVGRCTVFDSFLFEGKRFDITVWHYSERGLQGLMSIVWLIASVTKS